VTSGGNLSAVLKQRNTSRGRANYTRSFGAWRASGPTWRGGVGPQSRINKKKKKNGHGRRAEIRGRSIMAGAKAFNMGFSAGLSFCRGSGKKKEKPPDPPRHPQLELYSPV